MWRCLLNILLLTVIVHTSSIEKLKGDLEGFKELVSAGNDKIGNLTPTTRSLNLQDLSLMVDALRPLEGKSRSKRDIYEADDEVNDKALNDEIVENSKRDVNSITKSITLPLGGKGTSAFSVHAKTVYILYPSLFQDPNIFGRFSIPQNVNMDRNTSVNSPTNPQGYPPNTQPAYRRSLPDIIRAQPNPSQRGKRSADQPASEATTAAAAPPPQQALPEKRNVQTHLSGTIVVQNQDVNEFNRRESY